MSLRDGNGTYAVLWSRRSAADQQSPVGVSGGLLALPRVHHPPRREGRGRGAQQKGGMVIVCHIMGSGSRGQRLTLGQPPPPPPPCPSWDPLPPPPPHAHPLLPQWPWGLATKGKALGDPPPVPALGHSGWLSLNPPPTPQLYDALRSLALFAHVHLAHPQAPSHTGPWSMASCASPLPTTFVPVVNERLGKRSVSLCRLGGVPLAIEARPSALPWLLRRK